MTENEQNVTIEDPIKAHWDAIGQSLSLLKSRMERAKKDPNKPLTVGALAAIIEGDVFPFLQRTVELQAQLRDGTASALEALEERIEAVSPEGSSLTSEDAAVLRQVVLDLREVISVVRSAGVAAVVEAKLVEFEAHATQAESLLDDLTLEDDEDEGDDDAGEGAEEG
jgi:hypothetical protein